MNFLRFVVTLKLLGRDCEIKETTVGIHAFGKPVDYNPAADATVREAARALRKKLSRFYGLEGQNDPIEITIPTGTYVPTILDRRILIVVRRFANWNPDGEQAHLCVTITDEIAYQLCQSACIEVARTKKPEAKMARYVIGGSFACMGTSITLNIWLNDLRDRRIVVSETFEESRDDIIKLSRLVAERVVAALRSKRSTCSTRERRFVSHRAQRPGRKRRSLGHPDLSLTHRPSVLTASPLQEPQHVYYLKNDSKEI